MSPRQDAIDHAWSTARPPGVFEGGRVTAGEVIRAVRRARTGAAPGLDGIPVRVLQRCIYTLLPWLMRVFSGSLRGATTHWRGALPALLPCVNQGNRVMHHHAAIGRLAFCPPWARYWRLS